MHRFLWDFHYQPPPIDPDKIGMSGVGGGGGLPIAAIANNTVPTPNSPWVAPGEYTVKLTVIGKSYMQPLTVKMDPRVKTPALGLEQQFTLSKALYDGVLDAQAALQQLRAIRAQVKLLRERAGQGALSEALAAFDQKAAALEGGGGGGGRFGGGGGGFGPGAGGGQDTLAGIGGSLSSLMGLLQGADAAPTSQLVAAVADGRRALANLMARWNALKTQDLTNLKAQLKQANLVRRDAGRVRRRPPGRPRRTIPLPFVFD